MHAVGVIVVAAVTALWGADDVAEGELDYSLKGMSWDFRTEASALSIQVTEFGEENRIRVDEVALPGPFERGQWERR